MESLILTSLEAHREFVVNNIQYKRNREHYNSMMDFIIITIMREDEYKSVLNCLEVVFNELKEPWFSFSGELKYKKLALSHGMHVIDSINKRFGGVK